MIRVLIVDDHMLFADPIRMSLEGIGIDVVGIAQDGATAIKMSAAEKPDIVLVDIGLPDRSGLSVGAEILEMLPDAKVIALTALDDPRMLDEAVRLGFHGYLTKDISMARFESAILAAIEGQLVIPHRRRNHQRDPITLIADQLTQREREILGLLVRGLSSRGMAVELSISVNTVRTHVQSVLNKLGVHTRLEAATFAVHHSLVPLPQHR
ncbi:MAG: hypothetical protein QOE25_1213 [Actinomycetota bacterium]|nr:hypothetical protein [Actinomycetota bacterium]